MKWQPIDTAPKDGSTILLLDKGGMGSGHWESRIWLADWGTYYEVNPTPSHWMPIPIYPEVNDQLERNDMTQRDELQEMAIKHGILDSPTAISARNKIEDALTSIADEKKLDTGMGFGEWNFWVKINGVEYFFIVKPPKSSEPTREK